MFSFDVRIRNHTNIRALINSTSGPFSDLLKFILANGFSPQKWNEHENCVVANTDEADEMSARNAAMFHIFYARMAVGSGGFIGAR
jgi:hypothetical protein